MSSDKSDNISNSSIERNNNTFMNERQSAHQQGLAGNDNSSINSVYAEEDHQALQANKMDLSQHEKHQEPTIQQLTPSQHVSFFSKEYKPHRMQIHKRFALINLLMATLILTALAIYWGAFYEISDKIKDLKILVVIGDENTIDGVSPVFGNAMEEILQRPQAKASG
ncbi:Sng1 protein, partial [Candida orthopsilosis Co 90-125]